MRMFFAFLRTELMRSASNVVIGALARDTIQSIFLPKIQKAIDKSDGRKQEDLQEKYDSYAEYADTSKKGREFDKAAASAIRQAVKAFGGEEQDLDDVSQETAARLLGSKGSSTWPKAAMKFDPMTNDPRNLVTYFTSVVTTRARSVWRDISEVQKVRSVKKREVPMVDEDGNMRDMPSQDVELNDFEQSWMRSTMADMVRYVMGKQSKPWIKDMFKKWMALAISDGPDRIKFTKDIIEPMMESGEKGYPNTAGMYRRTWKGVVGDMVDYFENVLPKHGEPPILLTNRAKKKLLKAAADRVAATEFVARFRNWILWR